MNILGYLCLAMGSDGKPVPIIINPERDFLIIEKGNIPPDLQDVVKELEQDGTTEVLGMVTDFTPEAKA